MKRNINFSSWLPWEQNAAPFFLLLTLKAGMSDLRDYFGVPIWTSVIIFEDGQAKWLFRPKELKMLGQRMIDFLLCPPFRVSFLRQFEIGEQDVLMRSRRIQDSSLLPLSNQELISQYEEFAAAYCRWYAYGWFCEPVQFQAQDLINSYLESDIVQPKLPGTPASARQALFSIEEESFSIQILRDLRDIAGRLSEALKEKRLSSMLRQAAGTGNFVDLAVDAIMKAARETTVGPFAAVMNGLTNHASKYYWKKNNYFSTIVVAPEDVLREILSSPGFDIENAPLVFNNELRRLQEGKLKLQSEKADLLKILSPFLQMLVPVTDLIGGHLFDRRKRAIMIANAAFDHILAEIERRTSVPLANLHLLVPQEIPFILRNPSQYGERFDQRKRLFVAFQADLPLVPELYGSVQIRDDQPRFSDIAMQEPFIAEGGEGDRALRDLDQTLDFFVKSPDVVLLTEIRGVSIYYDHSRPVLEGEVCLVRDPKVDTIREGQILVTPSTTPDYMDLIRRSAAIVTDWGGQTSHAAIVARELRKPCVVGTNYASHVLRNGQRVRINFVESTVIPL